MPGLFRLNLLSVTIFAFCFLNGHVFPFFIHTEMFIAWFAFKFVFCLVCILIRTVVFSREYGSRDPTQAF